MRLNVADAAIKQLQEFSKHFIVTITDKAAGNFAFICKEYYQTKVNEALTSNRYTTINSTEQQISAMIVTTSGQFGVEVDKLYDRQTHSYNIIPQQLPTFFLTKTHLA
jgi:hypothetical protein